VAALKVFTDESGGYVPSHVCAALGIPAHRSQARVFIAAPTKAAASRMAVERGLHRTGYAVRYLREASGNDVDAIAEAGQFAEPGILVTHRNAVNGSAVVAIDADGSARDVGQLHHVPGRSLVTPMRLELTGAAPAPAKSSIGSLTAGDVEMLVNDIGGLHFWDEENLDVDPDDIRAALPAFLAALRIDAPGQS
jgi:hypothetical protein